MRFFRFVLAIAIFSFSMCAFAAKPPKEQVIYAGPLPITTYNYCSVANLSDRLITEVMIDMHYVDIDYNEFVDHSQVFLHPNRSTFVTLTDPNAIGATTCKISWVGERKEIIGTLCSFDLTFGGIGCSDTR